jgi:ubiquitin carboxyl-terminal hydrolase 20/33
MSKCHHLKELGEDHPNDFKDKLLLLSKSFWAKPTCTDCSHRKSGSSPGEVWICVGCGYNGCGRLDRAHMLLHSKIDESHSVCINTKSMMMWCYACDDEIIKEGDAYRTVIVEIFEETGGRCKKKGTSSSVVLKGTRGISNIGNTCFLAAALQSLSHVVPFSKIIRKCIPFSSHELANPCPQQRLVLAMREFILDEWSKNQANKGPIDPSEILLSVERLNSMFQGYHQHDSHEFLRFVLTSIHEEIGIPTHKKLLKSLISDIFFGKTCSTITCLKCNKQSKCIEDFIDLSLPIPSEPIGASITSAHSDSTSWWSRAKAILGIGQDFRVTLNDCFAAFTQPEKLAGADSYYCENCKSKNECMKEMSLCELPEVLVIHLKRFSNNSGGWSGNSKISKTVVFPVATNLEVMSSSYRLTGFVQHIGSLSSGHYIAYCKHKSTGQWFCFDDSRVSLVNNLSSIEAAEPYVLFYQKVTEPSVLEEKKLFRKSISSDSSYSYLPISWISRMKSYSSIPNLSFNDCVCPHGHPSTTCPEFAQKIFVKVKPEYAKRVVSKYCKDGSPVLESMEMCSVCTATISRYNYRLSIEHKLVSRLDTKSIHQDESWFFIAAEWVASWRQYLKHGQVHDSRKFKDPGPIDNKELYARAAKKDDKLRLASDYVAVNRHVWNVFIHCHGLVGPVIKRKTLDILSASIPQDSRDTQVELDKLGVSQEDWDRIEKY